MALSIYRTVSFIVCCVGTLVCITMAFVTQAFHLRGYPLYFLGNGCLLALGAFSHWYLDRLLTPKKPGGRTRT